MDGFNPRTTNRNTPYFSPGLLYGSTYPCSCHEGSNLVWSGLPVRSSDAVSLLSGLQYGRLFLLVCSVHARQWFYTLDYLHFPAFCLFMLPLRNASHFELWVCILEYLDWCISFLYRCQSWGILYLVSWKV